MRALVVDDEALARRGIITRLGSWQDVSVVGEAQDAESAFAAIVALRPDVIFLDIAMPGGDGFSVLSDLPTDIQPLVIVVSALDDRGLEAIGVEAIDYVLKPIDDQLLARAVDRARKRIAARIGEADAAILIRDRGRIIPLYPDAIDWIQSEGDYVRVFTTGSVYLHPASLTAFAALLPATGFARIHRTAVINVKRVKSLTPLKNGDYRVLLTTGARLRLSRTHRDALAARLGGRL